MLYFRKAIAAQQQSSLTNNGKDKDAEDFEEPEFLPLDDVLEG